MNRCPKRHVVAKVEAIEGNTFYGTNAIRNDSITECPRLGGEGYEKCKQICGQKAHAEIDALEKAGREAIGGTLTITGHIRICDECLVAAVNAGIDRIIIEVRS